MQTTLDSTSELVEQIKGNVKRYNQRLLHLLTFVPDDKLTWTPAPTSKSALRIVAHCALTNKFFAQAISGKSPAVLPPAEEFFANLNAAELEYSTRESAIALLEGSACELCTALASVNEETIKLDANSPFGPMPVRFWMDLGVEHTAGHVGQMEYLQTIWGDLDSHFGG